MDNQALAEVVGCLARDNKNHQESLGDPHTVCGPLTLQGSFSPEGPNHIYRMPDTLYHIRNPIPKGPSIKILRT